MSGQRFVAFDLGAESGRAVAGSLADGKLELDVLHRFPNGPVPVIDRIHWDALGIFRNLLDGLRAYRDRYGETLDGLGVDTWGVDFALIGADGGLLGNPVHYRDARTDGMPEKVFKQVSRREVYQRTGIQVMPINTLFQLYSLVQTNDVLLREAETMLFMPDLLNYLFTGERVSEYSIASTSQMYDMAGNEWATDLLDRLGIPTRILPEVAAPGSVIGNMRDALATETGVKAAPVIAPACHDTAAAVAAVPAEGEGWCFLSSGTWSLMGMETPEPIITEETRELNFTNEGGVDGTIRFLKNIMGLWLVQELRRAWRREGEDLDYAALVGLAEEAEPFRSFVDPDHAPFASPGGMPEKMATFCRETDQPVPETKGQFVRAALESLALTYRYVVECLEQVGGQPLQTIHIVGGGTQNKLLNRFTADATGRTVVTGPVEATAAGNVLMQAVALGVVGSIAEARQIVRASFPLETYAPETTAAWDAQYARFQQICGR
ncbi:MAG: rhamnulokinase [Planctomycetota bacterium]